MQCVKARARNRHETFGFRTENDISCTWTLLIINVVRNFQVLGEVAAEVNRCKTETAALSARAAAEAPLVPQDKDISLMCDPQGDTLWVWWKDATRRLGRPVRVDKNDGIVTLVHGVVPLRDFQQPAFRMLLPQTGGIMGRSFRGGAYGSRNEL